MQHFIVLNLPVELQKGGWSIPSISSFGLTKSVLKNAPKERNQVEFVGCGCKQMPVDYWGMNTEGENFCFFKKFIFWGHLSAVNSLSLAALCVKMQTFVKTRSFLYSCLSPSVAACSSKATVSWLDLPSEWIVAQLLTSSPHSPLKKHVTTPRVQSVGGGSREGLAE